MTRRSDSTGRTPAEAARRGGRRDATRESRALLRRARALASSIAAEQAPTSHELDPLALWRGLVSGRLTVVDHFSLLGRRFLVVRRAPPGGAPGGLSKREFLVCFLVARGHSNKLVSLELDLAPSTVATYLAKAMAKLGVSSRIELMRLFSSLPRARARRARSRTSPPA